MRKNMALSKDFLWGGALAARQFEGVPRVITDGVEEGSIILTM